MSDRIDRDVINALIAGRFADPFSVLGMHKTNAGLEVRALLPMPQMSGLSSQKRGVNSLNLSVLILVVFSVV